MAERDYFLYLPDSDSSDDYVPLTTQINGRDMAAVGSRRPPATMRPPTLLSDADAATGSFVTRRRLLDPRPSCITAAISLDNEPRRRRVVALATATAAEYSTFAPHGLSLYCIPNPSRPPRTTELTPLGPCCRSTCHFSCSTRDPPLGPGTPSSTISFSDVDIAVLNVSSHSAS